MGFLVSLFALLSPLRDPLVYSLYTDGLPLGPFLGYYLVSSLPFFFFFFFFLIGKISSLPFLYNNFLPFCILFVSFLCIPNVYK